MLLLKAESVIFTKMAMVRNDSVSIIVKQCTGVPYETGNRSCLW